MPRVSEQTIEKLNEFFDTLPAEAKSKCALCNETLTHIVKMAEVETGAGTATVTRVLSDKINDGAAAGDRVSGSQLRQRVRYNEDPSIWQNLPNNHDPDESGTDKHRIFAMQWTGDQESYTPEKYIEAARAVMGSIDLDPASNEIAQETVKAAVYYTKEDNGLIKKWHGNIFLNPPYSHPEIKQFVDKLLSELRDGQQAILLTNNNTDTNFFHNAAIKATMVCFTKGRINFLKADGSFSSPTNGQVFFYFGKHTGKFITHFSKFGILMKVNDNNFSG